MREKERRFVLELDVLRLFPKQGDTYREMKIPLGHVYREIKEKVYAETTDEAKRPDVVYEITRETTKTEKAKIFTFERDDKGLVSLADLVGRWGAIHKAFFETWTAMRKAPYVREMLNLIRVSANGENGLSVVPQHEFGDNKTEKPFGLLVPRSRGKTRQMEWYDYIENRTVQVEVTIPKTLPLGKEEFLGLVHALEFMNLHPLRRGEVRVRTIKALQGGWR